MTTKKLLAFVLSVLMIISVMPTTIFAAPSAVTAGDTVHEHNHNHFPEEPAVLSSDLDLTTLYIDISALVGERKTVSGVWLWVSGYIVNEPMIKVGRNIFSYDVTEAVANGATAATYTIYYTDDTALHSNLVDSFVTGKNMWVATGQTKGSWDVFGDVTGNIVITMTDSFGDSWNGAAIEIYEDNVFVDTITVDSDTNTYSLPYDELSEYTFKWKKGNFDSECSFVISLEEDALKTVDNAGVFADGEIIYTIESKCEHDVSEPCGACSVCSKVCGTDFSHKTDEIHKCSVCSFECGVTAEHDWSGRDGVCKVCGYECSHNLDENYACIICTYSYKALVTSEDGTSGIAYEFIDEALEAAESLENCTVKLLNNVSETTSCYIDSGKFTIDLNGKTWECNQWVLIVIGTADIKITDSTGEGGLMKTTIETFDLISLYDTAKLEIAGGSFESSNYVVDMSDSGLDSSSELIISGGKLSGYAIVTAKGSKVTITDGEFEVTGNYSILYDTGTLDLSQYADADKTSFYVGSSIDVSALNLILPEGFVLKDLFTEEVGTQPEAGRGYAIAKASGSETAMVASVTTQDGTTTTEYASIGEALTAAASLENSTVKLLDNVTTTDYHTIESGKFTIDLNGKIWQSSDVLLYIQGTSQIKICDSSENAGGLMTTSGIALIFLIDETKLEIESGNFSCTGNYIFNMSNSGMETSSELLISDGWFVGNSVASVAGRKATINSGEFDCAWGYPFEYSYGTLDLSNYKGSSEMGFYVPDFTDALALELILPAGAIIRNCFTGEIVTELASGVEYRMEFSEISSIEINLGEKADEANVRYAEIDGVVTEIEETDNKYLVAIGEENLLVEVTEKTADGEFVKSQYFYVDMVSQTATKLNMDSYMTADDNTSIRINNPMGMRFKSTVLTSAKNEENEYVIDEYGFIVATEEALGETELTFDFSKFVTGIAYNKESGTDIVFDPTNDEMHVFAGYVKNIPVANYKTNLVCKTYTKITVGGEQFVVYGEKVVGNVYDTAHSLISDETLDAETKNALYEIIIAYENTIGISGDDLYPEE